MDSIKDTLFYARGQAYCFGSGGKRLIIVNVYDDTATFDGITTDGKVFKNEPLTTLDGHECRQKKKQSYLKTLHDMFEQPIISERRRKEIVNLLGGVLAFAQFADVTYPTLRKWIKGEGRITDTSRVKITDALVRAGVDFNEA